MKELIKPIGDFSKKVNGLKKENSVIIESVQKLWREHYDEEFIQSKGFITDVDRVVEGNFVNLFQSSVVSLYTYLETTIKDLILAMISHNVTNNMAHDIPEVASINIPLVEFINLEEEQKYAYLTSAFEKQQGASVPYGIERFEKLLKPFDLSGPIDKKVKESINELAQTRNNLIHKAGVVNSWFMTQCGWLYNKYKIGDQLIINHDELDGCNC